MKNLLELSEEEKNNRARNKMRANKRSIRVSSVYLNPKRTSFSQKQT